MARNFTPYKLTNKTWLRVAIDLSIALILVYLVIFKHPQNQALILINAFMANLPDFDVFGLIWKKVMTIPLFKNYYNWHLKIQRETSSSWGIIAQTIVVIIALKLSL